MTRKSSDSLTDIQVAILQMILQSKATRGIVPSMREIAEAVGLSAVASVSYQLDNLEQKGYIRRQDNLSRNIEVLITPDGWEESSSSQADNVVPMAATAMVPLVGQIAAGIPITADQNIEEMFPLPRTLVGSGELFMLRVKGDSMIDAAICDGDWVVIRSQKTANNGDIVAAELDGEATVKTFKQRDGKTWLLPRNSAFEPIDGTHATIMGIVVSVLRKI
ncbi:MAG: transcriptional repressor LexA [Micrococcales bacterium]|nr:transcriptional repressor LexA [Micrococcales bacterium]